MPFNSSKWQVEFWKDVDNWETHLAKFKDNKGIVYFCEADHVGEKDGRLHKHCYAHFRTKTTMTKLQKLGHGTRGVNGSDEQNANYIRDGKPEYKHKPTNFVEFGSKQDKPLSVQLVQRVDNGENPYDLLKDETMGHVAIQYLRQLLDYKNEIDMIKAVQDWQNGYRPETIVYWSKESGLGKSYRAYTQHQPLCHGTISNGRLWVNAYRQGRNILLEEYTGKLPFDFFKELTDEYPMDLEIKGRIVVKNKSDVIITSNKEPCDWYPGLDAVELDQLYRRLEIHELVYNPITDMVRDNLTGDEWPKPSRKRRRERTPSLRTPSRECSAPGVEGAIVKIVRVYSWVNTHAQ